MEITSLMYKLFLIALISFPPLATAEQWASVKDRRKSYMYNTKKACQRAQTTRKSICIRVDKPRE